MSARWIPVLATRTLIAPTVTVLTAVLVNKDSLEMEQFVKVYVLLLSNILKSGPNEDES